MTEGETVYLVFRNRIVKAIDTKPGSSPYRNIAGRYVDERGKAIRNADAADPYLSLAAAKQDIRDSIRKCERALKAHRSELAILEGYEREGQPCPTP